MPISSFLFLCYASCLCDVISQSCEIITCRLMMSPFHSTLCDAIDPLNCLLAAITHCTQFEITVAAKKFIHLRNIIWKKPKQNGNFTLLTCTMRICYEFIKIISELIPDGNNYKKYLKTNSTYRVSPGNFNSILTSYFMS